MRHSRAPVVPIPGPFDFFDHSAVLRTQEKGLRVCSRVWLRLAAAALLGSRLSTYISQGLEAIHQRTSPESTVCGSGSGGTSRWKVRWAVGNVGTELMRETRVEYTDL